MKVIGQSSVFRRTVLMLLASILLATLVVGLVALPARAQTVNLSQGKPVVCSSVENAGTACANAVDGNSGTRWSSAFSDPQWIQVDLGTNYNITRLVLNWEAAYGRWYDIQVSADASNWSTIYSNYNGDGGTDDLSVSGFGRYVRMVGRARGTQWGYSLFEFQVYGSAGSTLADLVITNISVRFDPNVSCCTSEIPIAKPILGIDVAFMNTGSANAGPFVVAYRNTSTGATSQQDVSGLAAGQRVTLFFADNISYRQGAEVILDSLNQVIEANESNNTSSIQVPPEGTPLPRCTPTPPPPPVNLALNKPVTFSNQQTGNEAAKAVDGSTTTRWAGSPWPQWIRVDLGDVYSISQTELMPYQNRAYQYRIEVSTDGTAYTTVVDKTSNTTGGATLTDNFTAVSARYVRLVVTGASGYGGGWVSLYEFRVFGGIAPTPTTPPPTAPDLIVSGIRYAPATPVPCGTSTPPAGVLVTIKNIGNAAAGPFVLTANTSRSASVPGLAAGAEIAIQFTNMGGPITAVVDATNQIAESNETNNQLTVYLPIPTVPPGCTPPPPTLSPTFTPTPGPASGTTSSE